MIGEKYDAVQKENGKWTPRISFQDRMLPIWDSSSGDPNVSIECDTEVEALKISKRSSEHYHSLKLARQNI